MLRNLALSALIFIYSLATCLAQDTTLSPELQQMYEHAGEYMGRHNYTDAIVTYKQLLKLTGNNAAILTQLGDAYLQNADYNQATVTLQQAIDMPGGTDRAYELLAEGQQAEKDNKAARRTIDKGLERFPASGPLYCRRGFIALSTNDKPQALKAWLQGVEVAPSYSANYKNAAGLYLSATDILWGLLLGESYLLQQHDTAGDGVFKQQLYNGWKQFFDRLPDDADKGTSFEQAVKQEFTKLTPVVSDGISTENLVMVKTRFMLAWTSHQQKFPFPLFDKYDEMLRYGWFDICNEWLYGQAESPIQYDAWVKFHSSDIDRYLLWASTHHLHPVITPVYYNKTNDYLNQLYPKKKKR